MCNNPGTLGQNLKLPLIFGSFAFLAIGARFAFLPKGDISTSKAGIKVTAVRITDANEKKTFTDRGIQIALDEKSLRTHAQTARTVSFDLSISGDLDYQYRLEFGKGIRTETSMLKGQGIAIIQASFPTSNSGESVPYTLKSSDGIWKTYWSGKVGVDDSRVRWHKATERNASLGILKLKEREKSGDLSFRVLESGALPFVQGDMLFFEASHNLQKGSPITIQYQDFESISQGHLAYGKSGDPNNVIRHTGKVSLVALSRAESKGGKNLLWAPDGSKTEWPKTGIPGLESQVSVSEVTTLLFDIDSYSSDLRTRVQTADDPTSDSGGMSHYKLGVPGFWKIAFQRIPAGKPTADVILSLGIGEYRVASTHTKLCRTVAELKETKQGFFAGTAGNSNFRPTDFEVLVQPPPLSTGKFFKVIAYDKEGYEISMAGYVSPEDTPLVGNFIVQGYKPEDVVRVEVLVMDVKQRTFNNVALQPK